MRFVPTLSLLLVGAVLASTLAMGGVMVWNLRNGFNDYLAARESEHLRGFAQVVAEAIAQRGGVDALRGPGEMMALLDTLARREGVPADMPMPPPDGPPPAAVAAQPYEPPASLALRGVERAALRPEAPGLPDVAAPQGEPLRDGHLRSLRRPDPGRFGQRVSVYDLEGRLVAGRPPAPDARLEQQPVVLDGRTVAWVRIVRAGQVPEAVDLRFLRRQYLGIGGVALLLVAVAVFSATMVARRWARPLLRVQEATGRIARGEFATRLPVDGRDEVADVVRNVNAMAESLQRLEGARRRWLAEMSHELRTPLAVLRGELDALSDGVRPMTPAALASLREEVMLMGALVDDLHLLAMFDLGGLRCERVPLDLAQVVQRLQERFAARLQVAGLALEARLPPRACLLQGDPLRLEQVLRNLLENSLRYTDAPGRIVVGLTLEPESVVLSVDDTAPGVAAEHLPHLFEPLYRVQAARSRASGGSGLGLAICEAIVRAHGGTITAQASPRGGLRVCVTLPLEPPP